MTQPSILIAGVGNIFMGDDGFGVEVVRRLLDRQIPNGVQVVDFGIRGFDLAYALADGYDLTVLVDATPRGGTPGTIYIIDPDLDDLDSLSAEQMAIETHGMNPMKVLAMAKSMGGDLKGILVVGCEPASLGSEEEGQMGLSETVNASVEEAISVINRLVTETLKNTEPCDRKRAARQAD
jgi:hydrogenase maturation protease